MRLNPRYDDAPAVDVFVDASVIREAFLRQRRRLVSMVADLDVERLREPSRCADWTVADVLAHLVDVDGFWAVSLASGVAGAPTRLLASFDPEATPKEMVARHADAGVEEVRAAHARAASGLCDAVEALDEDAWACTAEAPPGHVSISTMLHHALWDCWIHERDIAVPLGLDVVGEDDELTAALAYVAAVSGAFGVWSDASRTGRLGIEATEPALSLVVDIGRTTSVGPGDAPVDAPTLRGRAADLIEGLSQRAELVHDLDDDERWMVSGLAEVFRADV